RPHRLDRADHQRGRPGRRPRGRRRGRAPRRRRPPRRPPVRRRHPPPDVVVLLAMRGELRHRPGGAQGRFGGPHRHYRGVDPTNTRARELAAEGAPHGTVLTADEQTEGRGRQGRTWAAPAGAALLYSAILRPLDERPLLLPLAVPIAVCETAE